MSDLRYGSLFSGYGGAMCIGYKGCRVASMPNPIRELTCYICGKPHQTRSKTTRTCSRKCGAIMRQEYAPNGRSPRIYPQDVIDQACALYLSGKSIKEVSEEIGPGYKIQLLLSRHLESRRPAAKRDQRAEKNSTWLGDLAGYQAVHLRMGSASDHQCVDCADNARHWSYNGGDPDQRLSDKGCAYSTDPTYYSPRCAVCHWRYDSRQRRANGQWANREEVTPNA